MLLELSRMADGILRAFVTPVSTQILCNMCHFHYSDIITGAMMSQITCVAIVYSDTDKKKHPSYVSLAFVKGIHRSPVNSPHTEGQYRGKCFHLMTSSCWRQFFANQKLFWTNHLKIFDKSCPFHKENKTELLMHIFPHARNVLHTCTHSVGELSFSERWLVFILLVTWN